MRPCLVVPPSVRASEYLGSGQITWTAAAGPPPVRPSICPSVCPFFYPSIGPSVHPSVRPNIWDRDKNVWTAAAVRPSVRPSMQIIGIGTKMLDWRQLSVSRASVRPSVCPLVRPSVRIPSVHPCEFRPSVRRSKYLGSGQRILDGGSSDDKNTWTPAAVCPSSVRPSVRANTWDRDKIL